ncbi:hypothetical protein MBRA_52950 (plasmid) [Mycobacterium branderi]|uniref:Uncharacterized protein n=1 Tax=Mycobacterium branderi TaxID=43348 RepID=A0ABM7KVC5_9MYCO|nr:hypothetical protein MBRA_52950 [Mycobacterium branderi]
MQARSKGRFLLIGRLGQGVSQRRILEAAMPTCLFCPRRVPRSSASGQWQATVSGAARGPAGEQEGIVSLWRRRKGRSGNEATPAPRSQPAGGAPPITVTANSADGRRLSTRP